MPQIALVSNQHDNDVAIGMISKLLKPARDVLIGHVLRDIVYQQSTHRTSVICRGNGSVSFLTSSVPDLGLDCLGVDLNRAGGEFDADSGFGVEIKLVTGETAEQVGFTDSRVTNQDDWQRINMLANIQKLVARVVKNNFLGMEAHVGRRHEALGRRGEWIETGLVPLKRNWEPSEEIISIHDSFRGIGRLTSYSSFAMFGYREG